MYMIVAFGRCYHIAELEECAELLPFYSPGKNGPQWDAEVMPHRGQAITEPVS